MREALDHWTFVYATYALGIGGTLLLVGWSWISMKRAEKRRDDVRSGREGK